MSSEFLMFRVLCQLLRLVLVVLNHVRISQGFAVLLVIFHSSGTFIRMISFWLFVFLFFVIIASLSIRLGLLLVGVSGSETFSHVLVVVILHAASDGRIFAG